MTINLRTAKTRSLFFIFLVILISCVLNRSEAGQKRLEALPIEGVLSISIPAFAQYPDINKNSSYVSYVLCNPRMRKRTDDENDLDMYQGCELKVSNITRLRATTLTVSTADAHGARWSPNGRFLAYVATKNGAQDLHIWDCVTHRSRIVTEAPIALVSYHTPIWTPDGEGLIVPIAAHTQGMSSSGDRSQSSQSNSVVVYRSEGGDSHSANDTDGPWSLKENSSALALVMIRNGATRILIPYIDPWGDYHLSPNGHFIAYAVATRFDGAASQQTLCDIKVLGLSDLITTTIAQNVPMAFGKGLSWSPNSRALAWITSGVHAKGIASIYYMQSGKTETYQYAGKFVGGTDNFSSPVDQTVAGATLWDSASRNVYVFDGAHEEGIWKISLSAGSMHVFFHLSGELVVGIARPLGLDILRTSSDNDFIVATINSWTKRTSFYRVNEATGRHSNVWAGNYKVTQLMSSIDGKSLLFFRERADESPDIWISPIDLKSSRRLTDIAPIFDNYQLGSARLISWSLHNGHMLQGALFLPAGYVAGKRYPLIVYPYPDRYKSNEINTFAGGESEAPTADNMQIFTTRGFAVLLPDAPYVRGYISQDLLDDVLGGVDKTIELGIADPARLGVMGHSDGGYTVLALIGRTHRFKAAVARSGYADEIAAAFWMDPDGAVFGLNIAVDMHLGKTLWAAPETWITNSPIFYFHHVTTPLLITQGTADTAVPPFLSDETFAALRSLGKTVQEVKYSGEGHYEDEWSYPHELDFVHRIIDWFDRFLCSSCTSHRA